LVGYNRLESGFAVRSCNSHEVNAIHEAKSTQCLLNKQQPTASLISNVRVVYDQSELAIRRFERTGATDRGDQRQKMNAKSRPFSGFARISAS
jgi:hypothetical protein